MSNNSINSLTNTLNANTFNANTLNANTLNANTLNANTLNDNKYKYNKNLSLMDLFFAGYGFIIGAGIFSLMPYVIYKAKGLSWLSFVVGGLVCLITGLSYAKLNSLYPSNDAEYSWILNVLNFDEKRDPKKVHITVTYLANTVIWIVVVVGLFMGATILVGQADFVKQYYNVNKTTLTAILVIIPSIITMIGNKYATGLNKIIMTLVTGAFVVLFVIAKKMGKKGGDIKFNVVSKDINPILMGSFITIFAYNGFQSIVQLSEESKEKKNIPISIVGSSAFAILVYGAITMSVISLIGVKAAGNSISPLSAAYGVKFGKNGVDIVNIIALVALTNTMLILTLSRSRLIQKLAVRGIAPNYLKKLTSLKQIAGLETFQDTPNKLIKKSKQTIPIYAIITLSVVTYILTFMGNGEVEYLAGLTSSFLFLVFTIVNILVIVNYYKKKTKQEQSHEEMVNKEMPLLKGFPWYSIIGLVASLYYLGISRNHLNLLNREPV
jgi:APA family basic amino acid/polyamine antiporter